MSKKSTYYWESVIKSPLVDLYTNVNEKLMDEIGTSLYDVICLHDII